MKNYINSEERTRIIILRAMQKVAKEFQDYNCLTEEEKQYLKIAEENVEKFHTSIYTRFGEPFERKIENTMANNVLGLYSKYITSKKDCISYCSYEDLVPKMKDLINLNCLDCDHCDFRTCGIYAMAVALDMEGNGEESGCPFKV